MLASVCLFMISDVFPLDNMPDTISVCRSVLYYSLTKVVRIYLSCTCLPHTISTVLAVIMFSAAYSPIAMMILTFV